MEAKAKQEATIFTIFGAAGDLTRRKLVPALYNLFLDQQIGGSFHMLGMDRVEMSNDKFRQHLREGIDEFSRRGKAEKKPWEQFAANLSYVAANVDDPKTFSNLGKELSKLEKAWKQPANRIFYLAVPPRLIEPIARGLTKAGLNEDRHRGRIVVEKPFGRDLASAKKLNRLLTEMFQERQIYRIDHYLGKETVQNILAFRFGNTLFEPVWNRRYIDHVQITVAEQVGIGHRGDYYEQAGALRDMIQNHLMQILCLVAMEPPTSLHADEVRNKKVDVLHAIRRIPHAQVNQFTVSGQYGPGWIEGEHVAGYRAEQGVARDSFTETYVAVKFLIDNWRWQGVPFYLRTGKRLPAMLSEVSIQFRQVPHQPFPPTTLLDWHPNRLLLAIQPEEGIMLRFETKYPGQTMRLSPVMMRFFYRETFKIELPDAYETLLLDVMEGDATLFMRGDQAEAAWQVITPILEAWETVRPTDFPNYQAGTWGPEEAEVLIAQDGFSWMIPTFLRCQSEVASCGVTLEPGS